MNYAPHPLSLRQLQYAVAVAELRSFRKAATACAVSQPALSAQVAHLEQAVGVKLFERGSARVHVTPAGERFVEQARELLVRTAELIDEVRRGADPLAGPLRLGVIPTVGPYLLPEVAAALKAGFPRLRFTWVEERTRALLARLKESELDGAIVALEHSGDGPELQSLVLGRDSFLLATGVDHPLAGCTEPVTMAVLDQERVLVLEEGHCLGDQVREVCKRARVAELDMRATSLSTLAQMVAQGAGVTLLPALAVSVENRRGTLHLRPFSARGPGRTLALVWRKGAAVGPTLRAIAPTLKRGLSAARPGGE